MRKTDAPEVRRGCSWSHLKYKALICSRLRIAPFQGGSLASRWAAQRPRSSSHSIVSLKSVSFYGLSTLHWRGGLALFVVDNLAFPPLLLTAWEDTPNLASLVVLPFLPF